MLRAGADEHLLGRGGDAVAPRPCSARGSMALRARVRLIAQQLRVVGTLGERTERAREIGGESDDREVEAQVDDGPSRCAAARGEGGVQGRGSDEGAAAHLAADETAALRPAYARVTVPIAMPSTSASSRCVGRRSPSGKRPAAMSAASALAIAA